MATTITWYCPVCNGAQKKELSGPLHGWQIFCCRKCGSELQVAENQVSKWLEEVKKHLPCV